METLDVYAIENGQEKVAIHNVSCQYPREFMQPVARDHLYSLVDRHS